MNEGGKSVDERVRWVLQLVLVKPPTSAEVETVKNLYQTEQAHYQQRIEDARFLATDPLGPLSEGIAPDEAAAWTVVANVLLNLDAVLSK